MSYLKHQKKESHEKMPVAQQHFAKGQDIREIHANAKQVNFAPGSVRSMVQSRNNIQPMWGEIPNGDWQDYTQVVDDVRREFKKLPAATRDFFNNDIGQLLKYVQNPANLAHCVKLKLLECPEGMKINTKGELVPVANYGVVPAGAPANAPESAPKADDEAQPRFNQPPQNGGNGGAT
jgi:hypothetical protein